MKTGSPAPSRSEALKRTIRLEIAQDKSERARLIQVVHESRGLNALPEVTQVSELSERIVENEVYLALS